MQASYLQRLACALAALCALSGAPAFAECLSADQLPAGEAPAIPELGEVSGPLERMRGGRLVAPMMVNGAGPFGFIVDTGANRSAVSQTLADRLGLIATGMGDVHTVSGVITAPLANVNAFRYGALELGATTVPVVQEGVLAGEHGLLGVDGMRGRRLRVDFENQCIEIMRADEPLRRRGWTRVNGELRFGHLVVIPGYIRGQHVNVLIDTGSDSTLANPAFREQVEGLRISRDRTDYARAYTAGTPIVMESAVLIPRMSMGEVEVTGITAYVADFHIFRLWEFIDEPAILIGMDVLAQTRAIAIDYQRASVHFRLHPRAYTGSRVTGTRASSSIAVGQ
jgi:predicted aspartyl protease